jgi:hypothetical protein
MNPGNQMPLNKPWMGGMNNGAGAAFNTKPYMFPQQPGLASAAASSNFNEMNEQYDPNLYDPNLVAVTQAAMRGMQQFGQMPGMENQQFAPYPGQIQSGYLRAPQGQEPMQMEDLRYGASQGQQKPQNLPGMLQRNR